MKFFGTAVALGVLGFGMVGAAQADTIAAWTFEISIPVTSGSFAAEIGSGAALGSHAGAAVYSSPAGNGSTHSFSSNTWAVGDYYQFSVSTLGFSGITLSWDQTSSATGPKDFKLAYSTNGTTFSDVNSYSVLVNGAPNTAWTAATGNGAYTITQNLAAVAALDNQALVYFRLIDNSTIAENGGAVATTGTDRVDNVTISGAAVSAVPVPAAIWLLGSSLMGLVGIARRRSV